MANQPKTSPVNATAVLELIDHCPGASKYLGSVDVNISPDGFVCVTRRVDSWTEPIIYVLSLGYLTKTASVTKIALDLGDPTFDRATECKALVNANGHWLIYYDKRHVWLQDLTAKPVETPVLLPIDWDVDILLTKWSKGNTAIVITEDGKIHRLKAKARGVQPTDLHLLTNALPFDHKSLRLVDFVQTGQWSASSSVRFEDSRPKGTLHLNFASETFVLSGFAGAFSHIPTDILDSETGNSAAQREKNVFVYADVGSDVYSLSISAIPISSDVQSLDGKTLNELVSTAKWKVDFEHLRSHDLKYPDLPIALHISPYDGYILLITQLSYVHVFQLADGSHIGSTRVSIFRISAWRFCKEKLGLLIADANGTIFQINVDIRSWISRLNIFSSDTATKLHVLRLAIQFEIPFNREFYAQFFPNLDKEHSKDAEELIGHLNGNQLLKFFTDVLKRNPTFLPSIRLMAKKFHEKIPMSDLIALFTIQGGANGVFSFLNLIGPSNLKGNHLVKYMESAIQGKQYGALTNFLTKEKVSDLDVVKRILKSKTKSDPKTAALFEKFCDRFDFVEDLFEFHMKNGFFSDPAKIKIIIGKSTKSQMMRVMKVLLDHSVCDAILDTLFLPVVQPSAFTSDLLELFRTYNRLKTGLNGLEFLAAKPKSDNRFVHLLLRTYQEEGENCETRKAEFFKKIGNARCREIGQTLEQSDVLMALALYKSSQCDWPYIKLALENNLFNDVALYLLMRADILLWAEVLVGEGKADIIRIFHTVQFRTELLKCPFPAVKALIQALVDIDTNGGYSTEALSVVELLEKASFQEKTMQAFFQEITLIIWITWYPEELTRIVQLLDTFKDYNLVKILVDLLTKRMIEPAKFVMSRLTDRKTEEVTESDIDALTSMASSCDEGGFDMTWLWTVIGNKQLEHQKLYQAMLAYIKSRHATNYTDVLKAIRDNRNFDHWDLAIMYLKMVERSVRDPRVNAALSIAYARTNRFDDLQKLLENSTETGSDEQNCRICEDAPKEIHFLPCHHVCACSKCADELTNCPICREKIADRIRVYLS